MADDTKSIICPNCNSKLSREDILMHMFPKATVIACPVCKKTISLQPKDF